MDKVTQIDAKGFVTADYDTATFFLSFSELAPKAKAAKDKLKAGVAQITKTLEALQAKGLTWGKTTFRTSVAVNPDYVYNNNTHVNELKGQKATYAVTFQTQNLELVNEAYDVLSELDLREYSVSSPVYSVRAVAELKQQALADAWSTAQVLFTNQCRVLDKEPNDYEVASWQVNYNGGGSMGKGRNFTNGMVGAQAASFDSDDAIDLNSGRAVVEVLLSASYVRKSL